MNAQGKISAQFSANLIAPDTSGMNFYRADPALADHPLLSDELRIFIDDDEAAFLFKS